MFSRRDFLRTSSLGAGAIGLTLAELGQAGSRGDTNCIFLNLVGGPSQLDTWDLKPAAPSNVRGPFRPIRTNVVGIQISECFPRMAQMADRFAILRSVTHQAAPIHETGHQLMQTGRVFRGGNEYPHFGAVIAALRGSRGQQPAFALVPGPIDSTGVSISHGQGAAFLDAAHEPAIISPSVRDEPSHVRDRYGRTRFGDSCLMARRLIESGTRVVTVNAFDTVFNEITWDCHADGGSLATDLQDYRETLCPAFDLAFSALVEDLGQRGLLSRTLIVAMGEFGRTPHLNPRGGRDHWPGVWSILLAGAGIRGGQVVGSSDALGGEPKDSPTSPTQVLATLYFALGIDPFTKLPGRDEPLVEASPILELL